MTKHELIRAYQEAGWALCKISPNNNTAFENGWNTREGAYTTPGSLDDWHGGIGLLHAYSGTCAIDIDSLKKAIPALARHGIDLPALLRAPGAVIYWRRDPDRLKLFYRLLEPLATVQRGQHGFEFRCGTSSGLSAQDVLPPSTREKGFPYEWRTQWLNLPELPAEIRAAWPKAKLLWPQEAAPAGPSGAPVGGMTAAAMVGNATNAFEGDRNGWLSGQLFGHLKRGGDYEASLEWLRALNEEKCSPPEDDDKVLKIWRNKGGVEPDPIVITRTVAGMEVETPIAKPELPHGYSWDGTWIYHLEGKELKVLIRQPLWIERIVRHVSPDGTEYRRMEVGTERGMHLMAYDHLISKTEVTLGNIGINVIEEDAKRVRRFLVRCKALAEEKGNIVDSYSTFGWQNDQSFLVGDTLYRPKADPLRVVLSEGLAELGREMNAAPTGSLEGWREAAEALMRPDNMSQAFGFLMGLAAPLMKLSGEKGGLYSLVGESGQGKSTVQNAICTLFGNPDAMRTLPQDTANARMIKLAMLSNLPMIAEEMTKMDRDDLAALAYAVSEGRDKDRATQEGTLREQVGGWHTLMVSSSNRSLMDELLLADGDAAAYRLLEDTVTLPKGTKQAAGDRIMRALVANQGHAARLFVQYLVDNRVALQSKIHEVAGTLADRVHGTTKERIRVNMLACAIVAGAVLNLTGILRFPLADYREYGLQVLRRNMGNQADTSTSFEDVLQQFIDGNHAGVLRMKGNEVLNVISIQGRSAPVIMRFDQVSNELTINQKALHGYVQERKVAWAAFKEWLNTQGFLKRQQRVILTSGSGLPAGPQVQVLVIDNAKFGGIDVPQDPQSPLTAAAGAVR